MSLNNNFKLIEKIYQTNSKQIITGFDDQNEQEK